LVRLVAQLIILKAHGALGRIDSRSFTMKRIGAFFISTWLAAAILYFGQHSMALIALSGVVALGGFDLLRP
jgi:hypothetical protein